MTFDMVEVDEAACDACDDTGEPPVMIDLDHDAFAGPVVAELGFVEECGGPDRLATAIAHTLGDPVGAALPMRFAFTRGRGENYELHVAHIRRDEQGVVVRRFQRGDDVVSRVRISRSRHPAGTVGRLRDGVR